MVLLKSLCFLMVLMSFGCSSPTSVPSSISAADLKSLEKSFARLDAVLADKAPAIHANLAPGATPAEIADLRAGLEGNQIDALEAWFRWHNGATGTPRHLLPLGHPLSISQALDDRAMIREIPLVGNQRKSAIKILEDGSGDGYFLDITSPTPLVYYEMLEDPGLSYYGTLEEFVDFIAEAFDSGILFQNDRGEFDYDEVKYFDYSLQYLEEKN